MRSKRSTEQQPARYYYTVVSNHPLGLTVTSDYGSLVIEAYGDNSDMREGAAVTSKARGDLNHTVVLAYDYSTPVKDNDEPPPSKPHLRIVK